MLRGGDQESEKERWWRGISGGAWEIDGAVRGCGSRGVRSTSILELRDGKMGPRRGGGAAFTVEE